MLPAPWHPAPRALGHFRELHRIAWAEDCPFNSVGTLHLHDHVSVPHMCVRYDLGLGVDGTRCDSAMSEFKGRIEFGSVRCPAFDRRSNDVVEVLQPLGGTRQGRIDSSIRVSRARRRDVRTEQCE